MLYISHVGKQLSHLEQTLVHVHTIGAVSAHRQLIIMSSRSDPCAPMLQTWLTHNIRTYPTCRMKIGPGPFAQLTVYLWPLEGLLVSLMVTPPSGKGDVLAVFAGLPWDVKWEVNGGSGAFPEVTHCNWEDTGVCGRHIRGYPQETVTSSCLQWWEGAG